MKLRGTERVNGPFLCQDNEEVRYSYVSLQGQKTLLRIKSVVLNTLSGNYRLKFQQYTSPHSRFLTPDSILTSE